MVDNTKELDVEDEDVSVAVDVTTERFKPAYKTVDRPRYRDLGEAADETSEGPDSLPRYTTIGRTRSTESDLEEPTSPKYVTLRRQRPATYREDESNDEEIAQTTSIASTAQTPRYSVKYPYISEQY